LGSFWSEGSFIVAVLALVTAQITCGIVYLALSWRVASTDL
jgi:hypothetical protein